MCGIVGYVGNEQAAPILLEGLEKLEYRGYDSAGLAVRRGEEPVEIVKAKGRLWALREMTAEGASLAGCCGIGHTRWATHGEPSTRNAHPHASDDFNVVAVHNGIIENHMELREKLKRRGYRFYGQTDTEVATKLIDYYIKKYRCGPVEAMARSMMRIRGSYALAVMFRDYPGEIFATRKDSPMVIGVTGDAAFLASDVPAILSRTRRVYYIENMEIARLGPGRASFCTVDEEPIEKRLVEITWDARAAEKCGWEHFMIKEIHEQPAAVRDTIGALTDGDRIPLGGAGLDAAEIAALRQLHIVACGSAYHVGAVLQYIVEDLARLPVRLEVASEFRYRRPVLGSDDLVIVISQSGETADSLAALREAKAQGAKTLAIVNVVGSSIAREADRVVYTCAGPEIAVATTKAYSAQLAAGYLLAVEFARARGRIGAGECAALLAEIRALPDKIGRALQDKERIQRFAAKFANARNAFFIGRGVDYAVALEGSLKLKEVSYIHSEACAAGELKHGPISLIEDGTLVAGVLTQARLREKMVSNMAECRSRGARLLAVTSRTDAGLEDVADFIAPVPEAHPMFAASLAVIPLQLLGYYVSVARGLDVDKPRNLAKSVTVE